MTNSCYDISYINEKAFVGQVYAKLRLFEGSYQDIDIDGQIVNQFVREKLLAEPEILFDFYIVPEVDFVDTCKAILEDYSNLPLIQEQV